MNTEYIVTAADSNTVTVTPAENGSACATCHANCKSCALHITVANTKRFDVKPGQKVRIGLSAKDEVRQSFLSLALPVLAAVIGFFVASPIASLFNVSATEQLRSLCVLVFLFASGFSVMLAAKKRRNPEKLDIAAVYQ
ncbi:SoxR reducing system RseC family protein [Treponema sp. Marseille-Q4132]|uniref:SoxR reducing system RseC family protein n=1 Tax=Treponema sp. Marseille-Q4132 TaxID=2766701 RepID=UPI0016530D94|nr:SoxR reducing system RseC family protein [Treponema sp. Marseille-Q4132]QNL98189.1 SoxR reducing system RseC family protein [Treponema sp. Marseille-Q4132]